jgi:hypothetical protein
LVAPAAPSPTEARRTRTFFKRRRWSFVRGSKYLEKKVNGLEFGTMLWFDKDRVLLLDYGGKRFLLNIDTSGSHLAVKLYQ